MLTTVAAFREPWEAHMFCGRLEAEGIPTFVSHECHIGNAWHYSVALGGVKVQVLGDHWRDARAIENSCRNGEFKSLLERGFGDLDDVRCPKCGSSDYWKRRPIVRAAGAITISFLLGVVLPPLGWVYFCEMCCTKFRAPLYQRAIGDWLNIFAVIGCELIIVALAVFGWALLDTEYWPIPTLLAAMLAGLWVRKRISGLDTEPE